MKKCPLKKPLNSYQLFIQDTLSNVSANILGFTLNTTIWNFELTFILFSPYNLIIWEQCTNNCHLNSVFSTKIEQSNSLKSTNKRKLSLSKFTISSNVDVCQVKKYFIFSSGNTSATSKCTTPRKYLGKTPFVLYASSKKLEESDFKKLRENYANLSLDEKYDWITKAIDEAPDKSVWSKNKLFLE